MPNFGNVPPGSPQQEAAFQRGFSHGVKAVLRALDARLTEEDRMRFREWTAAILEWRSSSERGGFEPPSPPSLR